jgi:hypothetical protein
MENIERLRKVVYFRFHVIFDVVVKFHKEIQQDSDFCQI